MSDRSVDALCTIFYVVPFEELYALDTLNYPWLQRITGMSLVPAVEHISASIKAVENPKVRLMCVALLYSWLIPRNVYHTWILYRLNEWLQAQDLGKVISMLQRAVQNSCDGVGSGIDIGTAVCITVLLADEERSSLEYTPTCFCVWRGLPFVAVHASEAIVARSKYWASLAKVIGDLHDWHRGVYANLSSAYAEAVRNRAAPVKVKKIQHEELH
nr:uncharacterized protein LOC129380324 [Dermacentor andersoni]